jgi:hypothetical protein
MKDIRIIEGDVLKLLQGLNISKARGPDEISPKILKGYGFWNVPWMLA